MSGDLLPEHATSTAPLLLEEYSEAGGEISLASAHVDAGTSVNQAAMSVVNIILGIGILSMPYAMNMAGWAGIASVLLCCALFCMSGKVMTWGLECIPRGRAHSYPELGQLALGSWGRNCVIGLAAFELTGGCVLIMVVIWKELQLLIPPWLIAKAQPLSSLAVVALLSILIEIPLVSAGSFRRLSVFSFLGCMTTLGTTALVLGLAFLDPGQHYLPAPPSHAFIRSDLPIATGIFALSVAGHSTFPSVRNSMKAPERFHAALHRAYALTAAILVTICGVGYWYWGSRAHLLITTDFELQSPYQHWYFLVPGLGVQKVLEVMILVNAVTTFPMLVLSLQDMACSVLLPEVQQGRERARKGVEAAFRLSMLLFVCGCAYRGASVFGALESAVGALCSILCSLMCPVVFYLIIARRRRTLTILGALGIGSMLTFGVLMVVIIVAQDIEAMTRPSKPAGRLPFALFAVPIRL